MVKDLCALLASVDEGLLQIFLCLLVVPGQVEQPSVGVEVGGVLRLAEDGLPAHFYRFFQIPSFFAEVVGVIVEDRIVVIVYLQAFLVPRVGLASVAEFMVQIPERTVAVDKHGVVLGISLSICSYVRMASSISPSCQ